MLGGEGKHNSNIAEKLNIDLLHKCSASLLLAFIKVRVLKDLTENYVMLNKEKPIHIRAGMTDKKTRGHLMLAPAYQFRNHPIIGTVPVLPTITTPLFVSSSYVESSIPNVFLAANLDGMVTIDIGGSGEGKKLDGMTELWNGDLILILIVLMDTDG